LCRAEASSPERFGPHKTTSEIDSTSRFTLKKHAIYADGARRRVERQYKRYLDYNIDDPDADNRSMGSSIGLS
jgi:hypothetical protein